MQPRLLAREAGDLPSRGFAQATASQLLRSFEPAPQHRFDGEASFPPNDQQTAVETRPHRLRAHGAGVSSLALEKFDGRILLSGGADGSIKLWDLESCGSPYGIHTFRPKGSIARSTGGPRSGGHSHGITHLAFYPFDPDAFLSSSYDKTLKLWATSRSALSAEFDLNATVYSHASSPIAPHLLISCATQHSNVRLVDLKSGSAVQALVAHGGPVLSTAWSPRHEHILVSGHADGKARIWDVRRAGGVIAQLDQDDSLGVVHRFKHATASGSDWGSMPHFRVSAQAHDEAVNGLQWTDDGRFIVSAGLDRRIRVWDADTGANTLASFGSIVQNRHAKTSSFLVTPSGLSTGRQLLVWPNEQEILLLDLHDGTVVGRLRSPGSAHSTGPRGSDVGRNRITNIAWRSAGGGHGQVGPAMGGGNSIGAIYSAHLDGQIRVWMPQPPGPEDADADDGGGVDEEVKQRKRKAIENAYRSLMGKEITFT
ncbi:dna excision repair ercc-8 [Trichoderma cornu-damae]|uniref:Dna excision repair ercc-8 n=1 Tax=Trichoderma cornu-damae TaxID=654480 RepID=A0A9P8TVK3_9HYPO|nr:dna excision repair ercc-8 [Trichoderma cornu-damae]